MIVYKIVKSEHGRKFSFGAMGHARVEYRPGVPAQPPEFLRVAGYGLTAYDDFNTAVKALVDLADRFQCELWEAEAEGIFKTPPPPLDPDQLSKGMLKKGGGDWPPHTILASKLTLLKKIGCSGMEMYVPVVLQKSTYWGVGPNEGIIFPPPTARRGSVTSPRSDGIHGYRTKSAAIKKASAQASHLIEGYGVGVLFNLEGLGPEEVIAKIFGVAKVIPLPNSLQRKKTGS